MIPIVSRSVCEVLRTFRVIYYTISRSTNFCLFGMLQTSYPGHPHNILRLVRTAVTFEFPPLFQQSSSNSPSAVTLHVESRRPIFPSRQSAPNFYYKHLQHWTKVTRRLREMRAVLAASFFALSQHTARAAVVEAGTVTTVTAEALLFDDNDVSADGGCYPAGCVGSNTRVSRIEVA